MFVGCFGAGVWAGSGRGAGAAALRPPGPLTLASASPSPANPTPPEKKTRPQVPNVRFCVAKQLQALAPLVDAGVVSACVRPCLQSLVADPDADVRFFASRALAACDGVAAA